MKTKELYNFLIELSENNNRQWFQANKSRWDDLRLQWLDDVQDLINKMSLWEPRFKGFQAKDCVFRIYRDVRFSHDKSPYKTWVCAGIGLYGKNSHNGGYYIQIEPQAIQREGFNGLFGGVWCPESDILKKLRKAIVDNIEEFREIINEPQLNKYFPGWTGEKLKTVPKGWDKNHPDADLLKLKEFGKAYEPDQDFFVGDWTTRASERLSLLKPLIDFLNYSIEEEL